MSKYKKSRRIAYLSLSADKLQLKEHEFNVLQSVIAANIKDINKPPLPYSIYKRSNIEKTECFVSNCFLLLELDESRGEKCSDYSFFYILINMSLLSTEDLKKCIIAKSEGRFNGWNAECYGSIMMIFDKNESTLLKITKFDKEWQETRYCLASNESFITISSHLNLFLPTPLVTIVLDYCYTRTDSLIHESYN